MQCTTCSRTHGSKLSFNCPTCARNALYELRLEHITTLLGKETLGAEVDKAVNAHDAATSTWSVEVARSAAAQAKERVQELNEHSERLRQEMASCRDEISHTRTGLDRRRADLASATHDLASRRTSSIEHLDKSIKRTSARWDQQHQRTAESRVFLCREAANLYGLRQRKRRKNGVIKEDYTIGGIPIIDLRDLNGAPPAHISTSLNHIAHLLVLASHYLSLQLPAEITLPYRDYPLPTIFTSASSYTGRAVPFPGVTPTHSSTTSPAGSRHHHHNPASPSDPRPLPRPRPLYIDKPLPVLAKDDPAGYALFVEGVCLLAWDIAWVCRTQGVPQTSLSSFEDACALGRNLWLLLTSTPVQTRLQQQQHSRSPRPSPSRASPRPPSHAPSSTAAAPSPSLGHFSHATAHTSLSSAAGAEYMRAWKMPSPLKLADRLKAALLGEMTGAEWEVVEEGEWEGHNRRAAVGEDEEGEEGDAGGDDDGGGGRGKARGWDDEDSDAARQGKARSSGANGWMKLKPR
ncbi:MAG: hypothetical protein M1833_002620 [Piccolia ochrophora]|nr:MAG: hypothetical protein M1833_002620 [Piccolia ochrophora]